MKPAKQVVLVSFRVDAQLKAEFEEAARLQDDTLSQILRRRMAASTAGRLKYEREFRAGQYDEAVPNWIPSRTAEHQKEMDKLRSRGQAAARRFETRTRRTES